MTQTLIRAVFVLLLGARGAFGPVDDLLEPSPERPSRREIESP